MTFPKRLAPAAYFVAVALCMLPLLDAAVSAFPPHVHDPRWRFGAVGLMINAMLLPSIGAFLAISTAALFEHRRTKRVLGALAAVVALACVGALVGFCLDAAQTRAGVRPELRLSFMAATVVACLKLVIATGAFGLLARAGFAPSAPAATAVRAQGSIARIPGIVVGRSNV